MASLFSCWRGRPDFKPIGGAPPRQSSSGGCELCRWRGILRELEGARAPPEPPGVELRGPELARVTREALGKSFGDRTFLLGGETREFVTCCFGLLDQVNQARAQLERDPLRLCADLCEVARATWRKRAAVQDGFAAVQSCMTHRLRQVKPDTSCQLAVTYDCLTYCDLQVHDLRDLPAVAVEYWRNNACFSRIPGRFEFLRNPPEYPRELTEAHAVLEGSRSLLLPVLMCSSNSRMGVHFDRLGSCTRRAHTAAPYCVIAIFDSDPEEAPVISPDQ